MSKTNRAVEMSATRRPRSFTRQLWSSVRIGGGMLGGEGVPVRFEAYHGAEDLRHVVALECPAAGEHLVEDAPNAQMSLRLSAGFPWPARAPCRPPCRGSRPWRHRRRGDGRRRRGGRCAVAVRPPRLGQPEVEHLGDTIGAKLDVGRLEVAVDDPLLVRGFERLGDLPRDGQGLIERDRAAGDALRQVLALDQLHDQRPDTA